MEIRNNIIEFKNNKAEKDICEENVPNALFNTFNAILNKDLAKIHKAKIRIEVKYKNEVINLHFFEDILDKYLNKRNINRVWKINDFDYCVVIFLLRDMCLNYHENNLILDSSKRSTKTWETLYDISIKYEIDGFAKFYFEKVISNYLTNLNDSNIKEFIKFYSRSRQCDHDIGLLYKISNDNWEKIAEVMKLESFRKFWDYCLFYLDEIGFEKLIKYCDIRKVDMDTLERIFKQKAENDIKEVKLESFCVYYISMIETVNILNMDQIGIDNFKKVTETVFNKLHLELMRDTFIKYGRIFPAKILGKRKFDEMNRIDAIGKTNVINESDKKE